MEFQETLKKAIESIGVTQTDIAQAIGVSQPLLGRYLKSKLLPKDDTLRALVSWFDERTPNGQSELGTQLLSAWTRSRLGTAYADRILASRHSMTVQEDPDMFADTSEEFKGAVQSLVKQGRRHKEIRQAVESLAKALSPVSPR